MHHLNDVFSIGRLLREKFGHNSEARGISCCPVRPHPPTSIPGRSQSVITFRFFRQNYITKNTHSQIAPQQPSCQPQASCSTAAAWNCRRGMP